jgi:hypothetical protein
MILFSHISLFPFQIGDRKPTIERSVFWYTDVGEFKVAALCVLHVKGGKGNKYHSASETENLVVACGALVRS